MHRSILLLFLTLILIGSCKPKETPSPQQPTQNDTTAPEPIDSLPNGYNANVMAKQMHNGTIGKSITSNDDNILALGKDVTGKPVIWKINKVNGSVIWMKEIAEHGHVFTGITETDNADIVVSGYKSTPMDSLIVRAYTSTGNEKWRKAFGEASHTHGFSQILSLSNSNLLIYNASIFLFSSNGERLQTLILDEDGNKISGYINNTIERCVDLIRTNNNDIIGVFDMPPLPFKIKHLSENGVALNTANASGEVVMCRAVKETSNGDLLCCGISSPMSGPGGMKGFAARFSSGIVSLDHDLYTNNRDFKNIIATDVGFIAVSGTDNGQAYMLACDHSGTVLWEKNCPTDQGTTESASNIFKSGSYYVLVGNCSTNKFFVMGVDEDGNIHP